MSATLCAYVYVVFMASYVNAALVGLLIAIGSIFNYYPEMDHQL